MIRLRPSAERGFADHGWLRSHHTFSFGHYHDPEHMGFRDLRVLNQDRVQGGEGFGTHGHRDMEIVSVVLDGTLEHRDSMGNGSQMRPGEVQLMSAGRGVTHSEFNASATEELHFLQMWILPAARGTEPRYEQRFFPAEERTGRLRLVVAQDGRDGALTIGQDAELWISTLEPGQGAKHEFAAGRSGYLHVASGSVTLNGEVLEAGDGAAIDEEPRLELVSRERAELVLWDLR